MLLSLMILLNGFKYDTPILYADYLKVVFPITSSDVRQSHDLFMHDFNNLSLWSEATGLNLTSVKCFILHYGKNIPALVYMEYCIILPAVNSKTDLLAYYDQLILHMMNSA